MNSCPKDLVISDEELSDIFLEVLRLYPPFIGSFRVADEDLVIGDHCVPGSSLGYNTFGQVHLVTNQGLKKDMGGGQKLSNIREAS